MAILHLSETQQNKAINAIAQLRVAHASIAEITMEIALPSFKHITDEAKQLKQAIGLLLAAVESGDEPTIAAATTTFEAYAAPLLEAELIRTGWYPKMTDSKRNAWFKQYSPNYAPTPIDAKEETWLASAISMFTHAAVATARQQVHAARASTPNWSR